MDSLCVYTGLSSEIQRRDRTPGPSTAKHRYKIPGTNTTKQDSST